jgi:hypothetical protein
MLVYTDSGVEVNCSMCRDWMDGKETVGAEKYSTLFKWLYVGIRSSRLNIALRIQYSELHYVL